MRPAQARRPPASYTCPSATRLRSTATMRPCFTPMSRSSPDERSARRALRTMRSTNQHSLDLDVGCLDQRPPFLDLRLLVGSERLRSLLVGGRNLLAQAREPRAHGRFGERVHGRAGELSNYFLR